MLAIALALLLAPPDDGLREAMLATHNQERARVGAAPLIWDDALATAARTYAERIAKTGVFRHSDELAALRQGENLFMGTRDGYSYAEMAGFWLDERAVFVDNPTPDFSTTGKWADAAHYTQMIWPTTTRLGCATASSAEIDYLVCRYSPQGNIVGQRAIPLAPKR